MIKFQKKNNPNIKIRLKGVWPDHWTDDKQWSFKIKFINEVFDVFTDLHSYIHDNAPENIPYNINLNKQDISIKLESPLEEDEMMID